MKKFLSVLMLSTALVAPALAQQSRSQVDTDINNMLQSCGNGCNTAASLRALMDIIVGAMFQQNAGNFIDPTYLFGADTTATATTGSITLGSNQLTVANPATWSVGQGIAVAGAGAGGAELVTSVTAINGDVFTLAENALTTVGPAAAVNHDDTAAFASAIALAQSTTPFRPIQLQAGTFNVTNVNTLTEAVTMFGAGSNATFIQNRGTANDVFDVTANVTFADFFITQAAGITPTAGYAIKVYAPVGACTTVYIGAIMDRINVYGTYGGLFAGAGLITSKFHQWNIYATGAGQGVYHDVPEPCGDNYFTDFTLAGNQTTGFEIVSSDTMLISNLKLNNGSEILFAGASPAGWNSGPIDRVRIINPSIEGIGTAGAACGIDFGFNGVTEVTVTGGEIAGFVNAYCNPNNNINGASHNVIGIGNMYGNGILNYQWPAPVFSGCGANGSASGGARDGAVVMTCAGATMVMTFAQGSTDNGWGCDVHDISNPSNAILQSGYSNMTATFGGTTTGAGAILTYKCAPW